METLQKLASNRLGALLLCINTYNQRTDTSRASKWYKGFQSGLMPNHMYIWFYMVVGKWFAPCGKCEEDWGDGAWVIGQLSLRGMEVLPLSAGLRHLFTFQTEELRGTRKGKWWAETHLNTFHCYKWWFWYNILTREVLTEMDKILLLSVLDHHRDWFELASTMDVFLMDDINWQKLKLIVLVQ